MLAEHPIVCGSCKQRDLEEGIGIAMNDTKTMVEAVKCVYCGHTVHLKAPILFEQFMENPFISIVALRNTDQALEALKLLLFTEVFLRSRLFFLVKGIANDKPS